MPRRPNTPCSGECGKLIWKGSGSLTPGRAMCHPCRAARRKAKPCSNCGAAFEFTRSGGGWTPSTCSPTCATARRQAGVRKRRTLRSCRDCLTEVVAPRLSCHPCTTARRRARFRRKNAVRRGAAPVGRRLSIMELGERDHWTCHLCRRRVGRSFKAPHPRSATFDHLIPVSSGGTDDPANLKLAHLGCNSRRGNRGVVQLQLIG